STTWWPSSLIGSRDAAGPSGRAGLGVAGELAVHAPVGLLDVLEDDVHLIGGGLADLDHRVGDRRGDLALLLVGAAGVPLHGDVGHGGPPVGGGPPAVGRPRAASYLSRAMSSGKFDVNEYDFTVPSALKRTLRSLLSSAPESRWP